MGRDMIFKVQHKSIPPTAENNAAKAVINRLGFQVITDFFTQMILSGFAYHIQAGEENAGVETPAALDDQLGFMLADNVAGYCMIPLLYEATPGVVDGATLLEAMLEVDKAKARYNSGGTAFVPANLRGDDPNTANGTFYITDGSDIAVLAKTAVPDSVELARQDFLEDTLNPTIGYPGEWNTVIYSARTRPICAIIGVGSIVCHLGAATDQPIAYGVLEFAQFDKDLVV